MKLVILLNVTKVLGLMKSVTLVTNNNQVPFLLSHSYMLIRLTKGETKAQIVACMHAPFLLRSCRQRFVSFGVASCLHVGCVRIRA